MVRLPQPGGDNGNWGEILNEYLSQAHATDGALKTDTVGAAQLKPHSVNNAALADATVTEAKLASAVQSKLNAAPAIADGSVTNEKLATFGQANGIATLDTSTKLPEAQLPSRLNEATLNSTFAARRVHIIAGLGQSNMSGRGAGYSTFLDPVITRIKQFGSGASSLTAATEPLAMHDTPSGMGPLLQFARNYLETLSEDDVIVVVPAAHGGTALSTNTTPLGWRWGVSGNLSAQAAVQIHNAINAAAVAYPGSLVTFDAVLWFQGETDSTAGNAIPRTTYQADLDALIAGVRGEFTSPTLPWIIYRMIPEALGTGTRFQIDACHQNTPYRVAYTGVVPSIAGESNGDQLHANANQHRRNGPVALAEYLRVKSGRAPVYEDYQAPLEPTIGSSIWLDTATRADDTSINGDITETGSKTWTRETSGTGTYTIGVVSNAFAPVSAAITGSTILYYVDNTVTNYWLRAVVTTPNQYQRISPKIINDQNYIVVYMASSTNVTIRKYVAGVLTDLATIIVSSAASYEFHIGWAEASERLIVKHGGVTIYDATVTGFTGVTKAGMILAGVSASTTGRIAELEALNLIGQ